MAALTLTNAPIHPFSIPQLTLTNGCIDPFQFSHWAPIVVQYPHWPWPTPPLPPPLTLTNVPTDPFQYLHWLWPMPPLTLFNATIDPFSIDPDECPQWPYTIAPGFFQCPHWPFSILPLDILKAPIENVQRHNWNFSTPPLKFLNTPKPNRTRPKSDWIHPKSDWIRTKSDWIRPLVTNLSGYAPNSTGYAPYPHQRLQTGVIGVSRVSKQYHAKHMQQYQLTQQNLNQIKAGKIATSPQEDEERYVEKYMIYYAVV